MSNVYLVGDVVTMSTTVVDSAGLPADPTSLVLAYTAVDGTTTSKYWPSPADITHDGVGLFHYDATGLTAGHYRYTYTSLGLYAGVDSDVFEVYDPALVPRLVSLADAKAFLRLTGTADDALLDRIVTWASARVIRELSAVVATTYTEVVTAGDGGFTLSNVPVVSLTSVTPVTSYSPTVNLANAVVTNSLGGTVGFVGTTVLYGPYTVVYRAGYQSVPPGVDGACLDLIRHWWNQSQAHGSATYGDDAFVPDFSSLPNSVINKLAVVPRIAGVA